ncbi:MAG: methyl-accepting chemotaxis protein [Elusimicrobia bacterium]|nr:methyl-accepting chemotaxis protein [Elusimicrobiota bacterium]
MEEKREYKRRIVIIKRALQFKYIAIVIIAMVLVAFTVGWDVYYTVGRAILDLKHPDLFPVMIKINNLMIGKLIILLVIVFIISIFVSHKFAGPIFKFEKSCETVATGDLTHRVHLRAGDELNELQDRFNDMISVIHQNVLEGKNVTETINEKLVAISGRISQKNISPSELSEISKQLIEISEDLNKILSKFKT